MLDSPTLHVRPLRDTPRSTEPTANHRVRDDAGVAADTKASPPALTGRRQLPKGRTSVQGSTGHEHQPVCRQRTRSPAATAWACSCVRTRGKEPALSIAVSGKSAM